MKRGNLLNADVSFAIASMGHTDSLVIGDAGLPIPEESWRIDLAVKAGLPSFFDVLSTVLEELYIEKVVLAEEIRKANPEEFQRIKELIGEDRRLSGLQVEFEFISHQAFKERIPSARAVVRTGEMKPYANIILYSGVAFS